MTENVHSSSVSSAPRLPEYHKKAIRSFVIRGGRMTEGQRNAFDKHWPNYGLSLFDDREVLHSAFAVSDTIEEVVIEVGFGMGDSLFEMAKASPQSQFIGIEVHPPGVGRLMHLAAEAGLTNLKLFMADATDVLKDCVPSSCANRFQLYFPDPWHKAKHHKRRILNAAFLNEIKRVLKKDGVFHMATDWEPYAEAAMDLLSREPGLTNLADEYCYAAKPDYRPETKFERRGQNLGHGVWDLLFRSDKT